MSGNIIYMYTRFERFWHWIQALFIMVLIITGFEVHGSLHLLGFERAIYWHNVTAGTWGGLYVFIVFWLLTTGQWKQYLPTLKNMGLVIHYYLIGIFTGAPHPIKKTPESKHNPLQRLTYLALLTFLLPLQIGSGLLYFFYNEWPDMGIQSVVSLPVVAILHTIGAFSLIAFCIVHVYMTTTGHTPLSHIKAMITGYEEG